MRLATRASAEAYLGARRRACPVIDLARSGSSPTDTGIVQRMNRPETSRTNDHVEFILPLEPCDDHRVT
jgi:hypothetical protein